MGGREERKAREGREAGEEWKGREEWEKREEKREKRGAGEMKGKGREERERGGERERREEWEGREERRAKRKRAARGTPLGPPVGFGVRGDRAGRRTDPSAAGKSSLVSPGSFPPDSLLAKVTHGRAWLACASCREWCAGVASPLSLVGRGSFRRARPIVVGRPGADGPIRARPDTVRRGVASAVIPASHPNDTHYPGTSHRGLYHYPPTTWQTSLTCR